MGLYEGGIAQLGLEPDINEYLIFGKHAILDP